MHFITFLIKNLMRRKSRSLLTICGFAVAVGTTVALMGVSESFERAWEASMSGRGIDLIVAEKGAVDQLTMNLDLSIRDRIEAVDGVRTAEPTLVDLLDYIDDEDNMLKTIVQGWEPEGYLFSEIEVVEGRLLKEDDNRKVVLGDTAAKNVRKKVGDELLIAGEPFEVVGIYHSYVVFENGAMTVPLRDLQEITAREGKVSAFSVLLEDEMKGKDDELERVLESINAFENEKGKSLGLDAKRTKEFVQNSLHIQIAHAMAWMTSAIAVVVGSIGVLNTMVMSVVERIREIAILRAIGWKKHRVIRMVMGEAILLSLVGATVGTMGALLLVQWLTTLSVTGGFIQGDIAPHVIGKGFTLALAVGVLGGAYPAWRAARLLPSEGLRHE